MGHKIAEQRLPTGPHTAVEWAEGVVLAPTLPEERGCAWEVPEAVPVSASS